MIFETLQIFALFVLAVGILPLCFFVVRTYMRSKRAIIKGMGQLDSDIRLQLGWAPDEYIETLDLGAPFRFGWNAWGQMVQQQNTALQRVLLRGLPNAPDLSEETRKSVLQYRLCFCAIALFAVTYFVPSFIGLSRALAESTGSPVAIWYGLFCFCIGSIVFLPMEKFKKWPEIGEAT